MKLPVLILTDVHFGYTADRPVLGGISAELITGRVCVLLGPNAAGKTTLLRLMLGQLNVKSGRILLGDTVVHRMPAARRAAKLAYVPQRPRGDVAFTVGDVVVMGRFALPRDRAAVEEAMRLCEVGGLRDRVFAELSAGQQQRVTLARAVAQLGGGDLAGRFLLVDEPVSAMDLEHQHHAMAVLTALARRGAGVLAVLHDLNLAARYADDAWLLSGGRLVAQGSWSQVLTPQVLEPVYRVPLSLHPAAGASRPMFVVGE